MKIERIGRTSAMNGNELWVSTESDEMITIVIKDDDLRWGVYCKKVKVTIETIGDDN